MGIEIERKFLVKDNGYKDNASVTLFHQGFLSIDVERVVRVRIEEKKATLTIKGKSVGFERAEFEYEIPLRDAEYLLENNCLKPTIKKKRHRIMYEGFLWEVDEFLNENEGLIIAEIELPEKDTSFEKPDWLGKEVTEDYKYYNANLVKKPYKTW